jgi:hypothetical protein
MSENNSPTGPLQNKGPLIKVGQHEVYDQDVERDGKLVCQRVLRYDQEVDQRFEPNFTPQFGLLGVELKNDRNARRSHLQYLLLDTEDLFEPLDVTNFQREFGGVNPTTRTEVLDATEEFPSPEADALLVVSSSVRHVDRAHAIRTTTEVERWAQLDKVNPKDPDAGGNKTIERRQVVAKNTTLPSGNGVLQAELQDLTETQSLLTYKFAPDGFRSKFSYFDTDEDGLGCETVVEEKLVEPNFTKPETDYLTIDQKLVDLGNGKLLFTKKSVNAWPTFTDTEEDPETGLKIEVKREILDRDNMPSITYGEVGKIKRLKILDCRKALLVTRTANISQFEAKTIEEWHNVSYYFPAWLDPTNPFSIQGFVVNTGSETTDNYASAVTTNRASDHTFKIPCKFVITFHSTPPTISEIFQFKPIDLRLESTSFRIYENDVLCDAGLLAFRDAQTSARLTFNIPASSPTASEFKEMMRLRTEVLIADDIIKWNYNLWKRVRVYLKMPDIRLTLGGYLSY